MTKIPYKPFLGKLTLQKGICHSRVNPLFGAGYNKYIFAQLIRNCGPPDHKERGSLQLHLGKNIFLIVFGIDIFLTLSMMIFILCKFCDLGYCLAMP